MLLLPERLKLILPIQESHVCWSYIYSPHYHHYTTTSTDLTNNTRHWRSHSFMNILLLAIPVTPVPILYWPNPVITEPVLSNLHCQKELHHIPLRPTEKLTSQFKQAETEKNLDCLCKRHLPSVDIKRKHR